MTISMYDSHLKSVADLAAFLKSSEGITFAAHNKDEVYQWIQHAIVTFRYHFVKRKDKGTVKMYIQKMTGYSRAQVTRLISQQRQTGYVRRKKPQGHRFVQKYTDQDIRLLAKTDALHDYPNGNALKRILIRMATVYRQIEYTHLVQISPSHIYTLRQSVTYKRLNAHYTKTKPVVSTIGERRKPEPNGKPGYVRVDTVHQGDLDKEKGVYHINMVDEVVQFEFVGACEKISEAYLLSLLEALLDCFPFVITEFHSDNGSEYINYLVADLLNRLVIKLTKSRARQSNDNALVEGKNNAIIRKWLGYGFIAQKHADKINAFYGGCFNEYLNYHRPCAFATTIIDPKGKERKVYKPQDYKTPYEQLTTIPDWEQYLKPGVTKAQLETIAMQRTDNAMAQMVQQQRDQLMKEAPLPAHSSHSFRLISWQENTIR